MSELLKGLSDAQKEVVTNIKGVVQVNAGAGSGKSRSIVHRVAYMVEQGISPSSIMLTTFTKKAAEDVKSRLSSLIPYNKLKDITVGTIHGICWSILKEEFEASNHHYLFALQNHKTNMLDGGKLKVFVDMIYNDMVKAREDSYDKRMIEELKELDRMSLSEFISAISHAKNNAVNQKEYEKKFKKEENPSIKYKLLNEFYKRYEDKKWMEKKLDFDDLLLLTYDMFISNKRVLSKYQRKWEYVMCDESQDNSPIQNKLLRMIASPENNLCLVGDSDQSIYRFRNAEPKQFIRFKEDYPELKQLFLLTNYRSRPQIVHMSNKVVRNNMIRIDKDAIPFSQDNTNCVSHHIFLDEDSEAEWIAEEIRNIIEDGKLKYKNICVLYRTNAQSKVIEDNLILNSIPYVIKSGFSFYQRKEILDILSYIRLAIDKTHDEAFKRIINTPSRFLGKAFMQKVMSVSGSHWDALDIIQLKPFEKKNVNGFVDHILHITDMIKNEKRPVEIISYIMNQVGYSEVLKKDIDGGEEREENIKTLISMAYKFKTVDKFLSYIDLMQNKRKDSINGVQLMSIHGSKGLEFDTVFLIGCNEDLLPHKYSESDEDIEEERRLMYVAMTRAINWLYMSSTLSYNNKDMDVSRFIDECEIDSIPMFNESDIDSEENEKDDNFVECRVFEFNKYRK